MTIGVSRPKNQPCGDCGASTAMEWRYIDCGHWVGFGRCLSCRSNVISFFAKSGVDPAFVDDVMYCLFAPQDEGFEALIA